MYKYYAGIGARNTPFDILIRMDKIAKVLYLNKYILRSGGAIGADSYFEHGADFQHKIFDVNLRINNYKEIFRPEHVGDEALRMASNFHFAWDKCNDYVKKLHGRNVMIILGEDLKTPCKFVICYTKNGKDIGGTGLGMRIAKHYNIPIYNLYYNEAYKRLNDIFLN